MSQGGPLAAYAGYPRFIHPQYFMHTPPFHPVPQPRAWYPPPRQLHLSSGHSVEQQQQQQQLGHGQRTEKEAEAEEVERGGQQAQHCSERWMDAAAAQRGRLEPSGGSHHHHSHDQRGKGFDGQQPLASGSSERHQRRDDLESEERLPSIYKGVALHTKAKKWIAQIVHKKGPKYLGLFADEAKAAAAYDMAALLLRGKDAEINFPLSNYLDGDGNIIEDQRIKERIEWKG